MEDAHNLFKIPESECPLKRNLYGHPMAGILWEWQFEKILLKHGWGKIPNWECLFVLREKGLFLSVYVDDTKLVGKKQFFRCAKYSTKKSIWENQHFSSIMYTWDALNYNAKQAKILWTYRTMFESRISVV